MIKSFLRKKTYALLLLVICSVIGIGMASYKNKPAAMGRLKVSFVNTANGKPLVLRDSSYTNAFGESYSISKLKYYISNFFVAGSGQVAEDDAYHLMNAADSSNSFEITLKPGTYPAVSFLLGVDSIRNCSGAQTGGLDPMNDMFWTWNSGYVMFKLEGNSAGSSADLQRIEHHIGGYKGDNKVATKINLSLPPLQLLQIRENAVTDIVIETNLDHYWSGNTDIKISDLPLCTTAGALAKKLASNFPGLFSIRLIK